MQLTITVSDTVWTALTEKIRQIQTQVPGERPGEVLIRPMFPDPGEWLQAIIDQNIQQHVPIVPDGEAARKIAEADVLRRQADDLIKAQRGIAVRSEIAPHDNPQRR